MQYGEDWKYSRFWDIGVQRAHRVLCWRGPGKCQAKDWVESKKHADKNRSKESLATLAIHRTCLVNACFYASSLHTLCDLIKPTECCHCQATRHFLCQVLAGRMPWAPLPFEFVSSDLLILSNHCQPSCLKHLGLVVSAPRSVIPHCILYDSSCPQLHQQAWGSPQRPGNSLLQSCAFTLGNRGRGSGSVMFQKNLCKFKDTPWVLFFWNIACDHPGDQLEWPSCKEHQCYPSLAPPQILLQDAFFWRKQPRAFQNMYVLFWALELANYLPAQYMPTILVWSGRKQKSLDSLCNLESELREMKGW